MKRLFKIRRAAPAIGAGLRSYANPQKSLGEAHETVMKKIRKGDMVILIAGRDKGRRGAVIEVLAGDRVRVEGLNMSKKHQRPNPQMGVQGGIIEREAPLHVSNVLIVNPATQKGDRVGFKSLATAARCACSSRTKKWSTPLK